MPDSSGSKDSPFDIGELIDSVLGQTAFFGANRHEQSENQQEAFEDIFEKLSEGAKVGNTYFQSCNIASKIFHLQTLCTNQPKTGRYQALKSIMSKHRTRRAHCRSGDLRLCSTVNTMTSPMMNFINC